MITEDVLDRIPTDAGVYLFKDAHGDVIYVGKAQSLRTRVRQYFRDGGDERFFVAAGFLARQAVEVETIVVSSSKEALLLENHLIKKHQPKFNVKLRDDKQYLVLRLVDAKPPDAPGVRPRDVFPRVEVVRNIRNDAANYFGPYHSATSARETLRTLNRHFGLRTCTDHVLETRGRPCLQYQIKRCPGPCVVDKAGFVFRQGLPKLADDGGASSAVERSPMAAAAAAYAEQVDDVKMFLVGKSGELVQRLRTRMQARADAEDFEVAAVVRDSIVAIERTLARQHVVQDDFVDQDVWGLYREADTVEVVVLFVRGGKLVGRRAFQQKGQELPDAAVIAEHVQAYYATGTLIPDEVVVGVELEDGALLTEWLSQLRGKKTRVVEPRRGIRARLIELADRNAAASATSRHTRDADTDAMLQKVADRLGLSRPPRRIECFDIAHIQGTETVASMVTFVDGIAARGLYRKFKVRSVDNNDFAAMYEVLTRRFRRAGVGQPPPSVGSTVEGGDGGVGAGSALPLPEARSPVEAGDGPVASGHAQPPSNAGSPVEVDEELVEADLDAVAPSAIAEALEVEAADPAWARPDLLVIDGGKGQLGMAVAALTDLGVPIGGAGGVEIIGLAKERELEAGDAPDRIYRRGVKDSIPLRANSPELYLLARIRDEAHRFANTFHRERRSKAMLRSELDSIPGIGAVRRQRLLKHFGSIRAIRQATLEDLVKAPGMTRKAAEAIVSYFATAHY